MLERFARGKQPTQKNPLLAIVITPRKNRKFSVKFRMALIYCKTPLVHTAVKDGLRGEGQMIPWLKVPTPGTAPSCLIPVHTKVRCEEANSAQPIINPPKSALNKHLRVEGKEMRLSCLPASPGQQSFHGISGTGPS